MHVVSSLRRKSLSSTQCCMANIYRYRVILDEAQCIKNRQTVGSKAAHDLMAMHRLVMTGTPMMNAIDELYPLIRFLGIPPYNDWSRFNQEFGKPLRANHSDTRKRAMQRVQVLLKSLMLRRQKDSLVDGQIVCKLPPKHLSKEAVEFSDDEMVVYKALENKAQITLNKYIKEDRVSGKYIRLLLQLWTQKSDAFVQPTTQTSLCFFSACGKLAATHI